MTILRVKPVTCQAVEQVRIPYQRGSNNAHLLILGALHGTQPGNHTYETYTPIAGLGRALELKSGAYYFRKVIEENIHAFNAGELVMALGAGGAPTLAIRTTKSLEKLGNLMATDRAFLAQLEKQGTSDKWDRIKRSGHKFEVRMAAVEVPQEPEAAKQCELELTVVAEIVKEDAPVRTLDTVTVEDLQNPSIAAKFLRSVRVLARQMGRTYSNQERIHRSFVRIARKLPHWTLRDTATVLQVQESKLADALIKEDLAIRGEDGRLYPRDSSVAKKFYSEKTNGYNLKIRPTMLDYLQTLVQRHGLVDSE